MGISTIGGASAGSASLLTGFAVGAGGTYSLDAVLDPGIYRVSMDTTQGISVTFSNSANDYPSFSGTTRGGSGWVSIPYQMNQITIPTGLTYPFLITLEKTAQALIAAPSSHSIVWNGSKTAVTGTWSGVPAGTSKVTFYWKVGSTTYSSDFSSTSSGATATIGAGTAPAASAGITYGIVCTNASSVPGIMGTGTTGAVPSASVVVSFTSTTVWVAPFTGTISNMLVVGGGGSGAGSGVPGAGGSGGAGGYRTSTSQVVTSGVSYNVTVGGAGSPSSWNGTFSASGGGGQSGAGGSGGGGFATGFSNPGGGGGAGNAGGYTPAEGTPGGSGGGTYGTTGGGGGGAGGGGASMGPGGAGVSNSITGTAVTYAKGGDPGSGPASLFGSGGGGGGYNAGQPGGAGRQGIVVIQYSY